MFDKRVNVSIPIQSLPFVNLVAKKEERGKRKEKRKKKKEGRRRKKEIQKILSGGAWKRRLVETLLPRGFHLLQQATQVAVVAPGTITGRFNAIELFRRAGIRMH